jgi:DNA-binding transcriptional regulator PaaX
LERFLREAAKLNWVLWFESPEKGPATDAHIAQRVWPLSGLAADYEKYMAEFGKRLAALETRQVNAQDLARCRMEEKLAYTALLQRDPFLPKRLLPSGFPGAEADRLHHRFVKGVVKAANATKQRSGL